jgi:TRAP-type C4-dicarboxylate transport system substrate-binding protein
MRMTQRARHSWIVVITAVLVWLVAASAADAAGARIVKYADFTGDAEPYGIDVMYFFREVERRTNGKVKPQFYMLNTLVPADGILEGVRTGVADAGRIHGGSNPGLLPLVHMGTLPGLGLELWPTVMAWNELVRTYRPIQAELARYKVKHLFAFGTTGTGIMSVVPIKSIDDLKGLKVRAVGGQIAAVKALGGVPISAVGQEIYTLLERGTIHAIVGNPAFMHSYGMDRLVKYYLPVKFGSVTGSIGMNVDVYNALPQEVQRALEAMAQEEMPEIIAGDYIKFNARIQEKMVKEYGLQVVKVDPAEQQKLNTLFRETIWTKWVQDAPSGVDRQAALDHFLKLYKTYEGKTPATYRYSAFPEWRAR